MMSNNWNPFFALANTRGKIDEAFDKRTEVDMPQLSDDSLEEIQEKILVSYNECSIIDITYFKNQRHIVERGVVSKFDVNNRTILINNVLIKFSNIIDVSYI